MIGSPAARRLYARQLRRLGPGYTNIAASIEAGTTPTLWVGPALLAIDEALRFGPQDGDGEA